MTASVTTGRAACATPGAPRAASYTNCWDTAFAEDYPLSPHPIPFPFEAAMRNSLSLRGYIHTEVTNDSDALSRAIQFAKEGVAGVNIKPMIDNTIAMDQIVDAHRYLESGAAYRKFGVRP